MVQVVQSAVDVRTPPDRLPRAMPHLHEVGLPRVATRWIPNHHFPPERARPRHHRGQEFGHRDFHFVGAEVDVGSHRKRPDQLRENRFQLTQPLRRLHRVAHCPLEGRAVARHVDFGNHHDAVLPRVGLEFTTLLLRVELSGVARHRRGGGQLRIAFHLEAPGLILRQMPVESVDFKAREQADVAFQVVDRNERATAVVHETAQLESRPVCDGHGLHGGSVLIALGQLLQRLCGANHARRRHGLDANLIFRDIKPISLVFVAVEPIVVGLGNRADESYHYPAL